jgi:ketosteroid isomerase-like protein
MSQENVEVFQRTAEAFRRRDIEAMLAELDPEVEWHPGLAAFLAGEATVYRGHEGVRELVRELDEHFAEFNNEYSEIRDLGDRVLAIGHIRARGRASGVETVSPLAFLVEAKDGKAVRVRTYLDPRDALEAAGLRE